MFLILAEKRRKTGKAKRTTKRKHNERHRFGRALAPALFMNMASIRLFGHYPCCGSPWSTGHGTAFHHVRADVHAVIPFSKSPFEKTGEGSKTTRRGKATSFGSSSPADIRRFRRPGAVFGTRERQKRIQDEQLYLGKPPGRCSVDSEGFLGDQRELH